ncbi:MAG: alkane 1-monooxygenase [Spirochaetia bacterium]|nr:alkane 1-monooxygenase [Spirochaetia bacterium]
MIKYLKYLFTPVLMSCVTLGILLGGGWMWLGISAIFVFVVGGDALSGDDLSRPEFAHKWILNLNLYATLPVLIAMLFALAWMCGNGRSDAFGFGVWIQTLTGYDIFAARAATSAMDLVGAVLSVGLASAGYGTNVAHELTHRTSDPIAMITGRWLLALGCQADFSIEHVYGHHLHVATAKDPATALRGENVYSFIIRSTLQGHKSAWNLESNRLIKRGYGVFSWRNRMLRGYAMSLSVAAGFAVLGGSIGLLVFLGQSAVSKSILEIVNYMEHYGLVRVPGQLVMPRHSWNTNKWMSSLVLYSLTRHSAHHEKGSLPFYELSPYADAPTMPFGYLTTIVIAMVPPLWNRVMDDKLADWDRRFATAEERALASGTTGATLRPEHV